MKKTSAVPPETPAAKGEHIFNSTYLTDLAIRWKKAQEDGKDQDALELLNQIIIGSTQMFERLAQYEGFDSTVDLSTLVMSAQERMVGWIKAWNPKKGKLFSWLSKCLHGRARLRRLNGAPVTIKEVVDKKLTDILAVDRQGRTRPAKIVDWHKNPATRKEWRKLVVYRKTGYRKPEFITWDHEVQLSDGSWRVVDGLTEADDVMRLDQQVTLLGEQAILGMFIGDGAAGRNGKTKAAYLKVSHGRPQRAYSDWLASKFRVKIQVLKEGTVYFNKCLNREIDQSGGSKVMIDVPEHLRRFLTKPKITPELVARLGWPAVAFWYMDDGSRGQKGGFASFSTCGFTVGECELLAGRLNELGVEAQVKPYDYPIISVKASSQERLFTNIEPFVLPLFDYKLPVKFRCRKKPDHVLVADKLVSLPHVSRTVDGSGWKLYKRFKTSRSASGPNVDDLRWKYDVEVETYHNFVIGDGLVAHNCSSNAFKSELVKTNTHRKRFHATSDNLEKFFGADDHSAYKDDAYFNAREKLKDLTVRWGRPQEIGAIRFCLDSIMSEVHDRRRTIEGVKYAFGISPELAKFFYNWSLFAMRNELYTLVSVPFTEQDLFRHTNTYSHLVDLLDIITWDQLKKIIMTLGGQRLKIPTVSQLARVHDDYRMAMELDRTSLDPDAVAAVGKKYGKSAKSAQEVYDDMMTAVNSHRDGEFEVYE